MRDILSLGNYQDNCFFLKKISRQLPSQLCAKTFSLSQLSSKLYSQKIFSFNCQVTCVTKNLKQKQMSSQLFGKQFFFSSIIVI